MTESNVYQLISSQINNGNFTEAASLLSSEMENKGFNDELAVLCASLNAALNDEKGCLSMIERGLKYNPANYELHLMLGNYYEESNIPLAYREYEYAQNYCYYEKGKEDEDYIFIAQVMERFKKEHKAEIEDYKDSLPILIYKSEEICYGVLNYFADRMKTELENNGELTEVIDVNEVPPQSLSSLSGNRYKAIVGIQTYLFSIHYNDGRNMHDFIFGPKVNIIFDHPCCMYNHLTKGPKDYIVLTHDRNYLRFIRENYPCVKKTGILPPGGDMYKGEINKDYEMSFIGSYKSPDTWEGVIKELDIKYSGKATELTDYIMSHPNETYEQSLKMIFGQETFTSAEVFFDLKQVYFKVMSYYREKVIKVLLEAGIPIHVFGESFNDSIWNGYDNLFIHSEVSPKESLFVYSRSRISLNIMSWHKDGRTERVANSMFNKSVVVSDKCQYLEEEYEDGKDIVLFDLMDIESLPARILGLLGDNTLCSAMAEAAYIKAYRNDNWKTRVKEFLSLLSD